ENSFFDFASVFRSAYNSHFTTEIQNGKVSLTGSVNLGNSKKIRSTYKRPFGFIGNHFFFRKAKKHIIGKEAAPWSFRNYTKTCAVHIMIANGAIFYINIPVGKVSRHPVV